MMFDRPFAKHISKYYPMLERYKMIKLFKGVENGTLDNPNSLEELVKHINFELALGNREVLKYVKPLVSYLERNRDKLDENVTEYYTSILEKIKEL